MTTDSARNVQNGPYSREPHEPREPGEPDEWLSALVDGEAQALEPACAQWRDDPQARRSWHRYHLIGDTMRSAELARKPAHDANFLNAFRERLAKEPVVLAPAALVASTAAQRPARSAWAVPVAAAVGFVLVTGVLVVARMGPTTAPAASFELTAASAPQPAALELRVVSDRQAVLVDPRLEEFLRVHQAAGGGMVAATPGGTLRRVDMTVPAAAVR
jgi:sigma-E factor negative regulatory protein RseA